MLRAPLLFLLCLAVMVVLTGCAGKIRYPSYYVLNIPAPISRGSQPKPFLGSVAIREFSAPQFLRGGPIVYRPSSEELDFYAYHRWAEDPRRAITSAVVENFQASGLFQSVGQYDGRGSCDYLVTGTLNHLEEIDRGRDVFVEASVSAQLMNLKSGELLWSDTSSETTKVEGRNVPGLVAGMSRAAEIAVEHLVSSMRGRLVATSASLGNRGVRQP